VNLILYPKLGTRSKRALVRTNRRGFKKTGSHSYSPKGTLLLRLARETGMTIHQVYAQLQEERTYLLSQDALN
jgi:hypothetical protein